MKERARYEELGREIQDTSNKVSISEKILGIIKNTPGIYKELNDILRAEEGYIPNQEFESDFKHSFDVAEIAEALPLEYYSKPEEGKEEQDKKRNIFIIAALLHDIGKDKVDPKILTSRKKLNIGQRKSVDQHVITGFETCQKIAEKLENEEEKELLSEVIAEIVLRHHIHGEGHSYPSEDQLHHHKNPEIEKMIDKISKALSVIDMFDALRSYRSYATPKGKKEVTEILQNKFPKEKYPEEQELMKFLITNFIEEKGK